MRGIIATLTGVTLLIYPFLMGWCLSHGYMWQVSILLLVLGALRLIFQKKNNVLWPLTSLAVICGSFSLIFKSALGLKFYPVMMSLGALCVFSYTLWKPPSMIERFARVFEPTLPKEGVLWTRKVTMVWCIFFAFNAFFAFCTVFFFPISIWVLYNGFISYLMMGVLLLGEFILRKRQQKIHNESY